MNHSPQKLSNKFLIFLPISKQKHNIISIYVLFILFESHKLYRWGNKRGNAATPNFTLKNDSLANVPKIFSQYW